MIFIIGGCCPLPTANNKTQVVLSHDSCILLFAAILRENVQ